jgi:hypothetical protein
MTGENLLNSFNANRYMKKNPREGACLSAAFDDIKVGGTFHDLAERNEILIVHGWAYSQKLAASIKHAWLEFTSSGIVYEPVNQVILDKKLQEFFRLRPVKYYTYMEILKLSIKTSQVGGKFEF